MDRRRFLAGLGAAALAASGPVYAGGLRPSRLGDDTMRLQRRLDEARARAIDEQDRFGGYAPEKNTGTVVDLDEMDWHLEAGLDGSGIHGLDFRNGTLIAESGDWAGEPMFRTETNTQNLRFRDVVMQCNQRCPGGAFDRCSGQRVERLNIWGVGRQPYGLRFGANGNPGGWSAAGGSVSSTYICGQVNGNWPSPEDPQDWTERACDLLIMDQHDLTARDCAPNLGRRGIVVLSGLASLFGNHPWMGFPHNQSLAEPNAVGIHVAAGVAAILTGNIIDNCVATFADGNDCIVNANFGYSWGGQDLGAMLQFLTAPWHSTITYNRFRGTFPAAVSGTVLRPDVIETGNGGVTI